ncbi:MAG: IgGFc-binding protein, partial [Tannerella sp.]|nr:IgGFc-binding protein [Tannerella sp.]
MRVLFVMSVIAFLFSFNSLKAQDTSFWFAAPDLADPVICGEGDSPMVLVISNGNPEEAHITITLKNGGSPIVINQTIASGSLYQHEFTSGAKGTGTKWQIENPRDSAGVVTNYGVHIQSDIKVSAYYQVLPPCNQDIYSLKGSAALGTDFYVPMIYDSYYYTGSYSQALDQIDIVATEDNTTVYVTPTKAINIMPSSTSPANTTLTYTMNRGQTLKLSENPIGNSAGATTLSGTHITSNKPVAVTTTEDLIGRSGTGWDIVGDQIVPVANLAKTYVVVKGLLTGTSDRAYFLATTGGTTVTVNNGSTTTSSGTLAAGQSWVFDLGNNGQTNVAPNAITATANNPVYCYHISGYGTELGSGLLPSIYSLSQRQLTFYTKVISGTNSLHGFVTFRTGSSADFTVTYGGTTSALSVGTVFNVPGLNGDWQAAKLNLPAATQNQVVTIKNSTSPFSFGYFSMNTTTGGASYGYLSSFGTFEFSQDTIYKCAGTSVPLGGAYAQTYTWTLPDGSISNAASLNATMPGLYKLTIYQDPLTHTDSVWVLNRFEGAAIILSSPPNTLDNGKGTRTYSVHVPGQTTAHTRFQWFINGVPQGNASTLTHSWDWEDEAIVSVILTDTVETPSCPRTLKFNHSPFPNNIVDAHCYTIPPPTIWDIERKMVSNAEIHSLATPF